MNKKTIKVVIPKPIKVKKLTKAELRVQEIRAQGFKLITDETTILKDGDVLSSYGGCPWLHDLANWGNIHGFDDGYWYKHAGHIMVIGQKWKNATLNGARHWLNRAHKGLHGKHLVCVFRPLVSKRYPLNKWFSAPLPLP